MTDQQNNAIENPELDVQADESAAVEGVVEDLSNDDVSQQLVAALAEVEAQKEQTLRTVAEMQNLRRRTEKDVENAHKYGVEKFAKELLPVLDNLERAIDAAGDEEATRAIVDGIKMTQTAFIQALQKFAVEVVDPVGEPFDPALHQAMCMVENPDMEANSVMAVMQKGYQIAGRLLRPAMVVVSKGGAAKTIDEQA